MCMLMCVQTESPAPGSPRVPAPRKRADTLAHMPPVRPQSPSAAQAKLALGPVAAIPRRGHTQNRPRRPGPASPALQLYGTKQFGVISHDFMHVHAQWRPNRPPRLGRSSPSDATRNAGSWIWHWAMFDWEHRQRKSRTAARKLVPTRRDSERELHDTTPGLGAQAKENRHRGSATHSHAAQLGTRARGAWEHWERKSSTAPRPPIPMQRNSERDILDAVPVCSASFAAFRQNLMPDF
ncbi:hypothetical protein C2E23DRAFT_891290 [Lenzites betulinus]|nr:hypothetical protein C2E23DRAFT_891290 [Lenzites betulinus]